MRVLAANVWVDDTFYPKGSVPAEDVAARIGDHAWEEIQVFEPAPATAAMVDTSQDGSGITDDDGDGDDSGDGEPPAKQPVGTPPPSSGPNASAKAWADYARANGVDVLDDAKRADVIQALTDAGIPVE